MATNDRRIVAGMGVVMARAFLRAACIAAMALAAGSSAWAQPRPAAMPDGPDFSPEQIQRGIELSPQQCAAYALTVFVEEQGVGVCFRYYISNAGGNAAEAVYWLSGDKSGPSSAYDPAALERTAVQMSQRYRRPAVYLARVGLDGSSGWHGWRRTFFEVMATNRAIDAINIRYGFRMVHVMGQSGGGHLTGSLIGLRRDIGCAVPGAGRLAFDERYRAGQMRRQPGLQHYDPATRIREVALQSRTTRILVVTDPNDRRVQLHFQSGFVAGVQRLGGRITQFFVGATDELSHAVSLYTREAMAGCLTGASDAEIEATLQRLNAFALARHSAQQYGQQPPTNYRQAVQPFEVTAPSGQVAAPARLGPPAITPAMPRIVGPVYGAPAAMPRVAGPGYAAPSVQPPPPPPGAAAQPYGQRYYR